MSGRRLELIMIIIIVKSLFNAGREAGREGAMLPMSSLAVTNVADREFMWQSWYVACLSSFNV